MALIGTSTCAELISEISSFEEPYKKGKLNKAKDLIRVKISAQKAAHKVAINNLRAKKLFSCFSEIVKSSRID
jgi:hypothetical protein